MPASISQRWKIRVIRNDQSLAQPTSFLSITFISHRTTLHWMSTHYIHMWPSSQKYRHFCINSLGSQDKHSTRASSHSPIVSDLHTHSMHVSLTSTSTQLPSHTHSHTITCTQPLTNSDVLLCHLMSSSTRSAFLLFLRVSLSTTPLAQIPVRHTNTIMLAGDSDSPLSLDTPFTLITFYCLTVLLKPGLCWTVTERQSGLGGEEGWFKPCPGSHRKLMAMSELMLWHRAQRQGLMAQKCLTCTSLVCCYSSFASKYEFTEAPAECHSSLNVSCQYSISLLSRLGRSDEQGDTLISVPALQYTTRGKQIV